MGISITKEVEVSACVDVEIEIGDVCDFIACASSEEIDEIQKAVNKSEKCTIAPLFEFDANTIRHLVERANIFGLDDMMDSLSREAERIGVILKVGV
ncbi:hypothetical protein P256_00732 [Acinetobacter nectaris CIP 110549]|uniref:Uncharacterized protein n=1 Tax=Acinetobacter nectaris CIP 110549 TaxID=1392540 RepID=V2TXB8_9GAMM|nr:hypothetical protein [Acinetobacter nectaris]ESK40285.1 hypothetical protein P256_00732 [Acinetobacter nectaris CIP 110549]